MTDLFGNPEEQPPLSPITGKPPSRKFVPRGYAHPPGSGPAGEFCKTCDHYCRVLYHSRFYLKCALLRNVWTHGPGTDILANSPACSLWRAPLSPDTPADTTKGK